MNEDEDKAAAKRQKRAAQYKKQVESGKRKVHNSNNNARRQDRRREEKVKRAREILMASHKMHLEGPVTTAMRAIPKRAQINDPVIQSNIRMCERDYDRKKLLPPADSGRSGNTGSSDNTDGGPGSKCFDIVDLNTKNNATNPSKPTIVLFYSSGQLRLAIGGTARGSDCDNKVIVIGFSVRVRRHCRACRQTQDHSGSGHGGAIDEAQGREGGEKTSAARFRPGCLFAGNPRSAGFRYRTPARMRRWPLPLACMAEATAEFADSEMSDVAILLSKSF